MKAWKLGIFLVCVVALAALFPKGRSSSFLPFDVSMSKSGIELQNLYEAEHGKKWKLARKLYEKHLSAKSSKTPRIPKIIHQIWIGGPLPEKYLPLQKTWIEKHPDWEYRLWTDADVPNFPFLNRERFEKAINVGEKADIFRYEILNLYGGLYVDTDFECVRPFDELHHRLDFYTGIFGAYADGQEVNMGNGLIGTVPGHPIIQYCMKMVAKKEPGKTADEVQSVSGPGCFRQAFFKCCQEGNYRNVAFPYTFFYPLPSHEICGHLDDIAKNPWIEPETFGIHYWDTSWGDKTYR
ncbi:MAG: hypothetical protein K1X28_01425 [Parachlamydiales bacterium]|nr:hypothetical protein [Parachlamydiales bacterium]